VAIVIAGLAVLFAYAGGWLTPHALTPASMINTFQKVNGLSVPGYYYRLDGNGDFYTSTCCPNTASEHRMFFKLMLDSLKIWAKHYLADGFRFDLMGFSFKNNMLEIKEALREIDPAIYLYGEGCDFGEVANNASKS
jgi:pullulanase/glycogen debranching enzyme